MWGAFGNKPVDKDDCPPPSLTAVPPGDGPDQLSIVHAIRVSNDGTVYVADRENRRVQAFSNDGKFIKQVIRHNAPFARNVALSPDAEQQFLYVGGGTDIVVVDRKSLEIVGAIEGGGLIGGGHQIGTDSKGNLYVAATNRGAQKLAFKGLKPAAAPTR
jgi:DNA-binding beta-propeller fold protein YncE